MKSSLLIAGAVAALTGGGLIAQQNSTGAQPRPNALPPVGPAQPKFGRTVPRPEGALPKVPDGFSVSVFAELPQPRMMVYAPNGDLFVSSPAANTVTVLRDANNNGRIEESEQSLFAGRTPPPAPPRGGGAGRRAGGPPPPPVAATPAAVNPTVNGPLLGAEGPAWVPPPPEIFNNIAPV
jgi:hypothetical protein